MFTMILWAHYFLALGFLSSPTVVSVFHILMVLPTIFLIKDYFKKLEVGKSAYFLLALFIWGFTSSLYNLPNIVDTNEAFQGLKFFFSGFLLIFPLYYFYERLTQKELRRIIGIVTFIVAAAFFIGISRAWFKFDPLSFSFMETWHNRSGGFTHYMRYGYASAFLFVISVSLIFNLGALKKRIGSKKIYAIAIFSFLGVLASQTRGALLGILVSIPFLIYYYKPLVAKAFALFASLFFISVLTFSTTGFVKHRYLNINDGSNTIRLSQFYSAVMAIQDNPIFGLGADQFAYHVQDIKNKYDISDKGYIGHTHNTFLEVGASFGIPGLLLFIAFIFTWLIEMLAVRDVFCRGVVAYIIAFTAAGQVENLFDNTNSHMLFYIYAMSQVYRVTRFHGMCNAKPLSAKEA